MRLAVSGRQNIAVDFSSDFVHIVTRHKSQDKFEMFRHECESRDYSLVGENESNERSIFRYRDNGLPNWCEVARFPVTPAVVPAPYIRLQSAYLLRGGGHHPCIDP